MRAIGLRPAALTTVAAGLVGLLLSACSPSPVTPTAAARVTPAASSAPAAATASPPSSTASSSAGPGVILDESLLGVLPADIGGVAVSSEPDSFAQAAADPDFVRSVESAVFAVVPAPDDLASGVVAKLRPGVYSEEMFRDWRDSYNAGACSQAGGVGGNAEAELGGRTVYIANCNGGLRVYHAYLPERGVIVSLFSVGDGRFGEQLMGKLRP